MPPRDHLNVDGAHQISAPRRRPVPQVSSDLAAAALAASAKAWAAPNLSAAQLESHRVHPPRRTPYGGVAPWTALAHRRRRMTAVSPGLRRFPALTAVPQPDGTTWHRGFQWQHQPLTECCETAARLANVPSMQRRRNLFPNNETAVRHAPPDGGPISCVLPAAAAVAGKSCSRLPWSLLDLVAANLTSSMTPDPSWLLPSRSGTAVVNHHRTGEVQVGRPARRRWLDQHPPDPACRD